MQPETMSALPQDCQASRLTRRMLQSVSRTFTDIAENSDFGETALSKCMKKMLKASTNDRGRARVSEYKQYWGRSVARTLQQRNATSLQQCNATSYIQFTLGRPQRLGISKSLETRYTYTKEGKKLTRQKQDVKQCQICCLWWRFLLTAYGQYSIILSRVLKYDLFINPSNWPSIHSNEWPWEHGDGCAVS